MTAFDRLLKEKKGRGRGREEEEEGEKKREREEEREGRKTKWTKLVHISSSYKSLTLTEHDKLSVNENLNSYFYEWVLIVQMSH